jgi:putative nucleotidyltransferase with HDIG domain
VTGSGAHVTEDRANAPKLSNSSAQDLLLRQFPAVAWTVDRELRVTSWAGRAMLDLGFKESDFIGVPINTVPGFDTDPAPVIQAHLLALQGHAGEFTTTWHGRDFHGHVEPLHENGHLIGCVGVSLDITDLNREAANAAKGMRFRLALGTLLEEVLNDPSEEHLYQRMVEIAIDAIPEAQAGSLWIGDGDCYRLAAAVGFDGQALAGVSFTRDEMHNGAANAAELQAGMEAMLRSDPEKAKRILSSGPAETIRTTLSLPVQANGTTLAFFQLHNFDREDAFADDHPSTMARVFATQVGALLERLKLEQDLRAGRRHRERLIAEYKSLAEFSVEIEKIHDTDELIEQGMERVLRTLGFDVAMIAEVKEDSLHFTRLRGLVTPELRATLSAPMPLGQGLNGRVALTGEDMFVEDYPAWSDGYERYRASGVESILVLPIRRAGRVAYTISFGTINRTAHVDESALRVARGFVARLENAFERVQYLEEIEATREATFRALGLALEYRDLETRGHTDRVVGLTRRFANELAIDGNLLQALVWGAYLHDIGKVAVPDTILLKPGKLTDEEFAVIRQHTIYGAEMTRGIPFLPTETRQVIRNHHERWDGRGYPDALAGNEIPLLARMFSLVDVYDALTSERPYKRAWSHDEAVQEIRSQAGKQFDAELARAFLSSLVPAVV